MTILLIVSVYIAIMFIAWSVTAWIRHYALHRMILDHPNQRSLHTVPTPRGGGLSISLTVIACTVLLWVSGLMSLQTAQAIGAGLVLVTITGWLDDHFSIAIHWRALCYLAAAAWACYWVFPGSDVPWLYGLIYYCGWVFAIAWLTNLYNFMDGSDGLAASETVCTALAAAILLANQTGLMVLLLSLAAASSGFLIWNWPPARIFMGDAGSCVVGYLFGTLALITHVDGTLSPAVWLILLSVFICDASLTLLKRMLAGEKWYEAHSQHAYQLFIKMKTGHKRLLVRVILINIMLVPAAYTAAWSPGLEWYLAAAVYALLGGLWMLVQIKYRRLHTA
jgi:Fuc2NAc and GlcNAc transferase